MPAAAFTPGRVARFGAFQLDIETGELRTRDRKVRLQDQPLQIVRLLLEHAGDVVTRESLRARLWPDNTFVDFDQGLNNAVRRLRDALSDSAETPEYVETLPRLGYRFVAPVQWGEPPAAPPAAAVRRIMLAVLPFHGVGESPEEYLSDGLTEETISQLGALAPDRLGVIARTSAMRYKHAGKSAADIGRELNVSYLLEGSVRRSGDRVRITAALIEVVDQTPRWSRVYESHLVDVLTTQKEVARAVVEEMRIQLSPERIAHMSQRQTTDLVAYELFLKGRHAWNLRTAAGLRNAIGAFERSLARDPLFAAAYAGLADAYSLMSLYDDVPARDAFPKAKAAALRALELDPNRGDAHTSLAYIAHRFDWNWTAAEQSYNRALELNPSYATAHQWYAEFLIVRGRLDEARAELQLAQQLDPLSPRIALDVSLPDYFAGDDARAIERATQVTKLHPDFAPAWIALRQYHERTGAWSEAIAALRNSAAALGRERAEADSVEAAFRAHGRDGYWRRLLELAAQGWPMPLTPAHRANMYAALGDVDSALTWLERALAAHDDEIVWIAVEPWYERLRGSERFEQLLARLDLAS
jgi:TolB-like protein